MSNSLRPHGLQHTRFCCPQLSLGSLLKFMSVEWVIQSLFYILPYFNLCPLYHHLQRELQVSNFWDFWAFWSNIPVASWLSQLLVFNLLSRVPRLPMVKNPPAVQETWARSLGWEDPLEKGMVTHRVQSMGSQTTERLTLTFLFWGPDSVTTNLSVPRFHPSVVIVVS